MTPRTITSSADIPAEFFDEVFGAYGEEPPFWIACRSSAGAVRSEAEALKLAAEAYGEGDYPMTVSTCQMYLGETEDGLTVHGNPEGMLDGPFDFWKIEEADDA